MISIFALSIVANELILLLVSKLPELLVQLEKTTWDGVVVKVNGVADRTAKINYSKMPVFDAPASVTYSGTVTLGPGEHTVCFEARSSTSGVVDSAEFCKTVVVEGIEANPVTQAVDASSNAEFTVRFVGNKPGCDTFEGKLLTVESCDGLTQVLQTGTGPDGSVTVTLPPPAAGVKEACYKTCHTAENGSKSCTTSTIEYTVSIERTTQ